MTGDVIFWRRNWTESIVLFTTILSLIARRMDPEMGAKSFLSIQRMVENYDEMEATQGERLNEKESKLILIW